MKNEIGNKYGKLVVLERAQKPEGRPKGAYWLCQCECGNQKVIRGADLRAGGVNSCGCLWGKHSIKNEMGNKYGRLTVIAESSERKFGSVCWICQCDCGNQIVAPGDELRNGSIKSCGCLNRDRNRETHYIDRTNQIYNKLTTLEIDEEKTRAHNHGIYWKCLCECGNYTSVLGTNLQNGSTKSCGCIKSSYGEELIEKILKENHIIYQKEYTLPGLYGDNKVSLRFDFAIFDDNNNLLQLIEYDGEQHFKSVPNWGGQEGLKQRQYNDEKKNQYCIQNNIKLVRIPFYLLNQITLETLEIDNYDDTESNNE